MAFVLFLFTIFGQKENSFFVSLECPVSITIYNCLLHIL